MGLLTLVDRAALAGYCQSWGDYCEAVEFLQEHGNVITIRNDKGVIVSTAPAPQFGISLRCLDRVRAFCSEFGFTPSSRVRLGVPRQPGDACAGSVLDGFWDEGAPGLLDGQRNSAAVLRARVRAEGQREKRNADKSVQ